MIRKWRCTHNSTRNMRQILQDLKSGSTRLVEVPCPAVKAGHVLIQTLCSLVSLGTESMLVEFSQANLIQKPRQQPDKVKQVLNKIRTDGRPSNKSRMLNRKKLPRPWKRLYASCMAPIEVRLIKSILNCWKVLSVQNRVFWMRALAA